MYIYIGERAVFLALSEARFSLTPPRATVAYLLRRYTRDVVQSFRRRESRTREETL